MKRESWLPATPESVASARAAVLEAGRGVGGLDDGALWELMLATSEAMANAIQHGEGCREPGHACDQRGLILLGIETTAEGMFVEVCDCGRFSAGLHAPDLESVGGRGIPIIAAVVDHLELLPTPDRTRIRFGKRVSVAGPAVQAS
jgi:anti-sigma regulatory factor (Ser/Thr protein kinase)